MKILVINGPNLNFLGLREPTIYGNVTLDDIKFNLLDYVKQNHEAVEIDFFQSNHEGVIIDKIQAAYGKIDGIIINPAAYSHTSIAIADAIATVSIPTVEVHLSDISKREKFRHNSFIKDKCIKQIKGCGAKGYEMALVELLNYLKK